MDTSFGSSGVWELSRESDRLWLKHQSLPVALVIGSARLHSGSERQEHDALLNLSSPTFAAGNATLHAADANLGLSLSVASDGSVRSVLTNSSCRGVNVGKVVLRLKVRLGESADGLSFFRNGYQSWTETRSFRPGERQMVSWLPTMSVLQDNPRNLPSGRRGEFSSDMFAVIGNVRRPVNLLIGQAAGFRQFVYLRSILPESPASGICVDVSHDLGGRLLAPGDQVALDEWTLIADEHANRVQDRYFDRIRCEGGVFADLPTGWCSWYYYYGRVAESDLEENLAAARAHQVDWRLFVLDDGYETAVGDWLSTNVKFPRGLRALAEDIRASGMIPGVWLAPFVARRNSRLFREHPDWLLKDVSGKPVLAGWNPGWGLEGRFYGLDTTNPDFQAQLKQWINTLVHTYGYRFLKLDFVYAACLEAVAHNPTLSAAERLTLGYRLIREAAGDGVFILGCGSPLAPARGLVNAMRIGPDVAPYWFAKYRYHLTRDSNALCCKFAIRNMLNRAAMHRRLWINDPDCLLLRDTVTKLTADERLSLANAIIVTGGMCVISDRLSSLPETTWKQMADVQRLAQDCDRGRAWPLDYMEREMPELVFNSRGYLAVFNFQDRPVRKAVRLNAYLQGIVDLNAHFSDVWEGGYVAMHEGTLDLGVLRPHASRLLKLDASRAQT